MLCPVDQSVFRSHEEGATQILSCELCLGFWFSREQLETFVRAGNATKNFPRKKNFSEKAQHSASQRCCPSCEKTDLLAKLIDGVEIDICPRCHGIWLDAGELELIITRYHRKQKLTAVSDKASEFFTQAATEPNLLIELGGLIGDALGKSSGWASEAAPALLDFIGEAFSSIDF